MGTRETVSYFLKHHQKKKRIILSMSMILAIRGNTKLC